MPINYVIPAAGNGSRFKNITKTPKPLIKINDRSLLEISLSSLPISYQDQIIIITQKDHLVKDKLQQKIQSLYPFNIVKWQEIEAVTKGQLETVYNARGLLDKKSSLAIFNCDTYFQSANLPSLMADTNIDGIVPCSQEPGECWSFCKVNNMKEKKVIDIAEKVRISDLASVGFYYFKDTDKFLKKAHKELSKKIDNEYYIAPLYKEYIADGDNIIIDDLKLFKPIGTPEQIKEYWGLNEDEILKQNQEHKVLVIDLDNTITIENPLTPYSQKKPNVKIINKIKEYKKLGYEIIINTARRMKTHKNDESKLIAEIADVTIAWLKENDVPFDGLKFGKTHANNGFYVDDKAIRPDEFLELSEEEIFNLISDKNE